MFSEKLILATLCMAIAIAPAAAQKVNVKSITSKMERSDVDITNEKKAVKAATWVSRGDAYFDAVKAPTNSIFIGMDKNMMLLTVGNPTSSQEVTIGEKTYSELTYDYLKAYFEGNTLKSWVITDQVSEGALEVALEAYNKAYEMDSERSARVKKGLEAIANYAIQEGNAALELRNFKGGADNFTLAFDMQSNPAFNEPKADIIYYAGYMYTMDGFNNPSSYADGAVALRRAIEAGFPAIEAANADMKEEDKGDIYYYLFHCYYGQREADAANIQLAKDALLEGIQAFPRNPKILEGLMELYTSDSNAGNPEDLIALVEESIANDPNNADLWFGRGRIYFALKNYDECIASFKEVTRLAPDNHTGHFYLGLFYTYKGDNEGEAMSTKNHKSQSEYDADLEKVNDIYAEALVPFERAHELNPTDLNTVNYLKSIYFRLRDRDGNMDKYTHYNELYKTMNAQ